MTYKIILKILRNRQRITQLKCFKEWIIVRDDIIFFIWGQYICFILSVCLCFPWILLRICYSSPTPFLSHCRHLVPARKIQNTKQPPLPSPSKGLQRLLKRITVLKVGVISTYLTSKSECQNYFLKLIMGCSWFQHCPWTVIILDIATKQTRPMLTG